ncbi:MAG: hypothetical protein ACM3XM_07675 [Mycobacterium leprae]
MNNPSEPGEDLKERLRRVLADNPEPPQVWSPFTADEPMGEEQTEAAAMTEVGATAEAKLEPYEPVATGKPEAAVEPEAEAEPECRLEEESHQAAHLRVPGPNEYARLLHQRLHAIRVIQEREPEQLCAGRRVRELSKALAETPGDSVHYRAMLHCLREVHEEWLRLEEEIAAANHIIRSTQWLVELLAEPPRRGGGD